MERQISNAAKRAKEAVVSSTSSLGRSRSGSGTRRSLSRSSSTKRTHHLPHLHHKHHDRHHDGKSDKGKHPERPSIQPLSGGNADNQHLRTPSVTVVSPPQGDDDRDEDAEEDEEGWASDGSVKSLSNASPTGQSQSKSPPRKISTGRVGSQVKNIVKSARKRGASFRKDHLHHHHPHHPHPTSSPNAGGDSNDDGDRPRGRDRSSSVRGAQGTASPTSPGSSSSSSARHGHGHGHLGTSAIGHGLTSPRSRVGKLVSDSRGPTREPSPARSVRFLDGQSGARTPRYGGTPLGGSETPPNGSTGVGLGLGTGVPMSRQESWRST